MFFLIVWAICAGIGYAIDGPTGAIWGLALGPIGIIIAAVNSNKSG